jgi:uncharacterized membrane protein
VEALGRFIRGGNLWVSGGVILLIAGFGVLIAYLANRGFFTLEMGIAAAALAGLVMILGGWFQRRKRRVYFLVLQGGGMGLLYLSIFAAHRFTSWISAPAALLLVSLLIPPLAVLAVFQRAQVLAVFAFLGGFAAPLLLSSPAGGGHVFLFAFYGVLAAGVFIISRFRSWSFLNLLAFLCVFGTALRWVMGSYRPSLFWSVEPFLLFYILLFTLLGLKPFGRKGGAPLPADHFILLGTPFAAALLEWKLFSFIEHGYALVSLGFSAFYLLFALFILKFWRREMELVIRGFLSLALFLANLAIPLELNPEVTGALWAAEGALIFLFGLQRDSWPLSLGGLILHGGAAAAFAAGFSRASFSPPFRGAAFTGSLIIAVSALVMGALAGRYRTREGERKNLFAGAAFAPFSLAITLWGLSWWFPGWFFEFRRVLNNPGEAFLVFTVLSAAGFYGLARLLPFSPFKLALVPAPVFALYRVLAVLIHRVTAFFPREGSWIFSHNFFDPRGLIPWLLFIVLEALLIILEGRKKRDAPGEERPYSLWTFAVLLITLILLASSGRALTREWRLSESWTSLAGLLPLYALLILIPLFPDRERFSSFFRKTNLFALPLGVSLVLALWFIATLFMFGSPRPLPFYVPLLNPLDLLEGLCIAAFLFWQLKSSFPGRFGGRAADRREAPAEKPFIPREGLFVIADLAVFLWIAAVISRCLHFYGGVSRSAMAGSGGFRISLFVFLGLYGIVHIIGGRRIKNRPLWIAGAVMILLDISKFLILDLAGTGAGLRILSFFVSGLILLFIGWAAPLPPDLKEAEGPASEGS